MPSLVRHLRPLRAGSRFTMSRSVPRATLLARGSPTLAHSLELTLRSAHCSPSPVPLNSSLNFGSHTPALSGREVNRESDPAFVATPW